MDLMYLENLEEFIYDENQIVTYRWLSLTLGVPSNVAKQMLFHYHDKSRNSDKECKLSATYLISGIQYDDEFKQDVHKICVVQDEELKEKKNTFKTIYSVHIYSLQKKKIKDLHTLYGEDYNIIKEDIFKSAKYSSISPASPNRSTVQTKHQVPTFINPKNNSPKKDIVKKEVEENSLVNNNNNNNNKENKLSETASLQKRNVKSGKGVLQSMFANQAKKNEIKKPLEIKEPNANEKSCKSVSEESKKKGFLDTFLSKSAETPSPPEGLRRSPRKTKGSKNEEEDVKGKINSVVKNEEKRETRSSPRKKENKVTKNSTRSQVQKGKRKSTTTGSKSTKRQRIMILDSSSESENDEEEEEEHVLSESPIPSPSKALQSDDDESPFPPTPKPAETVEQQSHGGKRRKKKEIVNTFEDDKGFLVVKKGYELATDSDEDDLIPSARTVNSSPKAATERNSPTNTPLKCTPERSSPRTNTPQKNSPKKRSPKTNTPQKNSPKKISPKTNTPPKDSPKKKSPRKRSPKKKKNKSPAKGKQSSITSFFKLQ